MAKKAQNGRSALPPSSDGDALPFQEQPSPSEQDSGAALAFEPYVSPGTAPIVESDVLSQATLLEGSMSDSTTEMGGVTVQSYPEGGIQKIIDESPPGKWIGNIDVLQAERVIGWAFYCPDPTLHATIRVLADGEVVGWCTANIQREDLEKAGFDTGDHGFECRIPIGRLKTAAHVSITASAGAEHYKIYEKRNRAEADTAASASSGPLVYFDITISSSILPTTPTFPEFSALSAGTYPLYCKTSGSFGQPCFARNLMRCANISMSPRTDSGGF